MNPQLIIDILGLAASLITGAVQGKAAIASALLSIVQKAALAYQQHQGQPLDPSLIQPEAQI